MESELLKENLLATLRPQRVCNDDILVWTKKGKDHIAEYICVYLCR